MPPISFTTVSTRLLEYADATANHFKIHGYKIYPEKIELGFPYTPTILCKRSATTLVVEVSNKLLDENRLNAWVGYAKSCTKDTRIAICLPPKVIVSPQEENILKTLGVGLYIAQGENQIMERIPPKDLALQIELPQLASLSRKLQGLLGSAYEQFDRSHWREGFEDACQVFETEARKYLKHGIKISRITIMGSTGPRNPTPQQIDKMTIGQLAKTFSNIQNQNYLDVQIGKTLDVINGDRIGVVHHKAKLKTEKKLRANVGQHMWSMIQVLKQVV